MIKYTKTHEWARIEGAEAVLGISDHAQQELGDIVFIELPQVGDKVKKEERFGTVESTKAASELFSPLSGEVVAVNEDLGDNPQWVNESPEEKGWMIKIRLTDPAETESLLDDSAYKSFISEEI